MLFVISFSACTESYQPQWKADATSEFEVGTQLRPWTIRDEGWETILENCQSMAGVNNIYLIVIMHEEHRPFHAEKFPIIRSEARFRPKTPLYLFSLT